MSTSRTDGGPAFPRSTYHGGHDGMSLRDYFAAQALGSLFTLDHPQSWERDDFAAAAELAFRVADAMLQARSDA